MKYLCLIYQDESRLPAIPPEDMKAMMTQYDVFTREVAASGHLVGGEALQPTSSATTVRVREGKTVVTDGPFAETKEQLGGYYLIEAADLDEAVRIAARIPGAQWGSIEVRPLMVFQKPV